MKRLNNRESAPLKVMTHNEENNDLTETASDDFLVKDFGKGADKAFDET